LSRLIFYRFFAHTFVKFSHSQQSFRSPFTTLQLVFLRVGDLGSPCSYYCLRYLRFLFQQSLSGARLLVDDSQKALDAWKLDPSKMPRRLDLDLSDEVYDALEALSRRTGRPIRDLVEDFIAQSVTPPLPPQEEDS
jgi:hypothetical protein